MSSKSDNQNQNMEREVIRLLYELLSKWDNVLEYTDEILRSIANKYQNSDQKQTTLESTLKQMKLISGKRTDNENNEIPDSVQRETSATNKSPKDELITSRVGKTWNNTINTGPRIESTDKNTFPKNKSNTKRKSFANELEEHLTKLDQIIDYYKDLKARAVNTIISHGKTSKAAKDVNQEMKDVIENYDKFSIND